MCLLFFFLFAFGLSRLCGRKRSVMKASKSKVKSIAVANLSRRQTKKDDPGFNPLPE
jgi:hypothetical protein